MYDNKSWLELKWVRGVTGDELEHQKFPYTGY